MEDIATNPVIIFSDDHVIAVNHEDSHRKTAQILVDQIFRNHVVSDCILDMLAFSDILSCALVCKTWNNVTKEFLRRQRVCLLKCDIEDLEGLDNRRKLLENVVLHSNHPFQGVHFVVDKLSGFLPKRLQFKIVIEAIFTLTTTKYITITYNHKQWLIESPQRFHIWFFNFLRTRVPKNETEHLRLIGQVVVPWENFTKINTSNPTLDGFSNLQTFERDVLPWEAYLGSPAPFIHGCAVLKEFRASTTVDDLKEFNEFDKLPLLRWINLRKSDVVNEVIIKNMEKLEIPLEVLSLEDCDCFPEQIQCVHRLVQLSYKTLQKVILVDFCRAEVYKMFPCFETISIVQILHPHSGVSFSNISLEKQELCRIFPNAKIIPNGYADGPSYAWR